MDGEALALADWPGARCNRDYCAIELTRAGKAWHLLLARGMDPVPERALAAACERSDIVIAARWLPRPCRPRWIKADRNMLGRTGGLAIYLNEGRVVTVAEGQGRHGWWREPEQRKFTRASAPNEDKATPQPKTQPEP